ncbi:MAG: hypothetical protein JXR96_18900, partial [Deltaproteobacteria bacterium]|nr:hypothetical protein [Deltaproteobacteria bacterium]
MERILLAISLLWALSACSSGSADCTQGETRCQGSVIQTCVDGSWQDFQDCAEQDRICELEDGTAACADGPACTDGERRCYEDRVERCAGGAWDLEQDCAASGQVCEQTGSQAACAEGPACTD